MRHCERVAQDAPETGDTDEPHRRERPQVAQPVPEERDVEARSADREREDDDAQRPPARAALKAAYGDRQEARDGEERASLRQELRGPDLALEERAEEDPEVLLY